MVKAHAGPARGGSGGADLIREHRRCGGGLPAGGELVPGEAVRVREHTDDGGADSALLAHACAIAASPGTAKPSVKRQGRLASTDSNCRVICQGREKPLN